MHITPEAQIGQEPTPVGAAVNHLKIEFVSECLRIAALKAQHCADNLDIEDLLNADRDLRLAIQYLREASVTYRQLRQAALP